MSCIIPFVQVNSNTESKGVISGNTCSIEDSIIPIPMEFRNEVSKYFQAFVNGNNGVHLASTSIMNWGCFTDDHIYLFVVTSSNASFVAMGKNLKYIDYDINKKTCTNKTCVLPSSSSSTTIGQFIPIIGTDSIIWNTQNQVYKIDLASATTTVLLSSVSFSSYIHPLISSDNGGIYFVNTYIEDEYNSTPLYKYNMKTNTLTQIGKKYYYKILDIINGKYKVTASYATRTYGGSKELRVDITDLDGNSIDGTTIDKTFTSLSKLGNSTDMSRLFAASPGIIDNARYTGHVGPRYIGKYDISDGLKQTYRYIGYYNHTYIEEYPNDGPFIDGRYAGVMSTISKNSYGSQTMHIVPQFVGMDGKSCMTSLLLPTFSGYYSGTCTPGDVNTVRTYMMKLTYKENES